MALQTVWSDPTSPDNIPTAYARVGTIAFDDINKQASVSVTIYRSQAARNANLQPLTQVGFQIHATAQPARAAVKLPNGTIVQPATPAVPSYDEVESLINAEEFADSNPRNVIKTVVYRLLKNLPEFSGSVDI